MPNTFAPYGFRQVAGITGVPQNFGNSTEKVQAAYGTPILRADPVTRLANGYLGRLPAGAGQVHGIADGCRYSSAAKSGATNYSQFFPANTDVLADASLMVLANPLITLQAQTGNSAGAAVAATQALIGLNIGVAYGPNPNTKIGFSSAYLDLSTVGVSAALPFKILALVSDPPGVNGADPTTPFFDLLVGFNSADYRAGTAGI